jgi:integrase/recombinase XerD
MAMTPIESEADDYLEWMEIHNYAKLTIECRGRYLDYFITFARNYEVDEAKQVTLELLLSYQHSLFAHRKRNGQPLSFGTQVQRLIPVTEFFSWLRREHRILTNPAADLLMPRPDRRLPEATLSAAEMAVLLGAPDVSVPLGLRDRAVLEVFYSCGLRRGELISLWLRDVDFDRGTVFVRHGKGAKDRYVPIGERALFWVRLYVEIVRPGFVTDRFPDHLFLSSSGTPLCPDWLCRRVRGYLAASGIDKRGSCHLLRHTVATLMLEGGADIRYVAEMLGHSRLETTQRYTRVSIERLRTVHANCHPAAGLSVAMASELCTALPGARSAMAIGKTSSTKPVRT